MKLTLTEAAINKINELNKNNYPYLLLRYDTKGMGCGVNGLPTFCLVEKKDSNQIDVENDTIPTLITEMQAVFFAENLKIDYVNGTFRLSSPEGILNPFISSNSIIE